MTYENYKPWEVSLAIIEIARNLCGFRKQQIKIWQILHGNETIVQKCILDILKLLKDDKEKSIGKLNVEASVLDNVLKELENYS
jgi:hypothetical protein